MRYEIRGESFHVPDQVGYLLAEISYRLKRLEEHLQLPSLEALDEAAQIPDVDEGSSSEPAEEGQ